MGGIIRKWYWWWVFTSQNYRIQNWLKTFEFFVQQCKTGLHVSDLMLPFEMNDKIKHKVSLQAEQQKKSNSTTGPQSCIQGKWHSLGSCRSQKKVSKFLTNVIGLRWWFQGCEKEQKMLFPISAYASILEMQIHANTK